MQNTVHVFVDFIVVVIMQTPQQVVLHRLTLRFSFDRTVLFLLSRV